MKKKIIPFLILWICTFQSFGQQKPNPSDTISKYQDIATKYMAVCKLKCKRWLAPCINDCQVNLEFKNESNNIDYIIKCTDSCEINFNNCAIKCNGNQKCIDNCRLNFNKCFIKYTQDIKYKMNCHMNCGQQYMYCYNECNHLPECFVDNDCGYNFECHNKKCIKSIICKRKEDCPKEDMICYKGKCYLFKQSLGTGELVIDSIELNKYRYIAPGEGDEPYKKIRK
jgi:hypothetical protein